MFDKGKREQRHEKEDAAFNKMLLCIAGAVVVELIILLFRQLYVNGLLGGGVQMGLIYFVRVFRILGAVLSVAGIVWAVLMARKKKPVMLPCICTAVAAGLWVLSALSFYLFDVGLDIAMILPAAGAVLIMVYFLYQRVFFFNAMLTAGGLVALWIHRQYYADRPRMILVIFVAGYVLLAAALVLSFVLRGGDGRLGGIRLVPSDTSYLTTWITCGVTALALTLALALGTTVGLYLLFALAAWLFVQAVFFTVKLM